MLSDRESAYYSIAIAPLFRRVGCAYGGVKLQKKRYKTKKRMHNSERILLSLPLHKANIYLQKEG